MRDRQKREDLDWASDLEMLASAIGSGLKNSEALQLLGQRSSHTWRSTFELLQNNYLRRENLALALVETKLMVADYRFDLLAELLVAHGQFGGAGLVESLTRFATNSRSQSATEDDVRSRLRSVLAITRLGVLAPWLMALLLSSRPENLSAFFTDSGPWVLVCGGLLTLAAWRLVVLISRLPIPTRGLAT